MKNLINLLAIVVTLCLITLSFSCASSPYRGAPALENRTLRLSPDFAGFEYQYEDLNGACVDQFLWVCRRHVMKKDLYDLTKPEVRKQLIDMGFVARVREKQE